MKRFPPIKRRIFPIIGILALAVYRALEMHAADFTNPPASVVLKTSNWNGYEKQSFTLDGAAAYVVVPKAAAPGKPWVWRTSFPDYQPVVDLELLRRGYHIRYVEILDLLGSDKALDLM